MDGKRDRLPSVELSSASPSLAENAERAVIIGVANEPARDRAVFIRCVRACLAVVRASLFASCFAACHARIFIRSMSFASWTCKNILTTSNTLLQSNL
jgi:hypothetical protein